MIHKKWGEKYKDRKNLVLRYPDPYFPPSFGNIACWVAYLCFRFHVTTARKWEQFIPLSGKVTVAAPRQPYSQVLFIKYYTFNKLTSSPCSSSKHFTGRPQRYFILSLYFWIIRCTTFQHVHSIWSLFRRQLHAVPFCFRRLFVIEDVAWEDFSLV